MFKYFLSILFLKAYLLNAQELIFDAFYENKCDSISEIYITDTEMDQFGNVYNIGVFGGQVDFDPGSAITLLSSSTYKADIFIQKLGSNGELIWAKAIHLDNDSSSFWNRFVTIAIDKQCNVYVGFDFHGEVDVDPSNNKNVISYGLFKNYGQATAIVKLNSNAIFEWVHQINYNHFPNVVELTECVLENSLGDIKLDNENNVYIFGRYTDSVRFDYYSTPYLVKLNSSGIKQWVKLFERRNKNKGSNRSAVGWEMLINKKNELILCVGTNTPGIIDCDPSLNETLIQNDGTVLVKLSNDGELKWAKSIGKVVAFTISIDSNDNIYIGGTFKDSFDANPESEINTLVSKGAYDIYISKFDNIGSYQWSKSFGSILGDDICYSTTILKDDAVLMTGYYNSTIDFSNIPSDSMILKKSGLDPHGFLVPISFFGKTLNAQRLSGENGGVEPANIMYSNKKNEVVVTGNFAGEIDFDPSENSENNQYHYYYLHGFILNLKNDKLNINSNKSNFNFSLFPNPTSKSFKLVFSENESNIDLRLLTTSGAIIKEEKFSTIQSIEWEFNGPSGLYFLEISNGSNLETIKLIKQ